MKQEDIKEFEIGSHCFGEILSVNGFDYDLIPKEDVLELILDMFKNNPNSSLLIRECLKTALDYLEFEAEESDSSDCDSCGNWNYYTKWVAPKN